MELPRIVVGRLFEDKLTFKPVAISKTADCLKWLDPDELVEFTVDLLRLVDQIANGRKGSAELALFLSEWRETALLNQEPDVLIDKEDTFYLYLNNSFDPINSKVVKVELVP